MRLLDVRHEQTAVFAAEALGKLTRVPGLAVLTAGPGVTNGVSAVTQAQFSGSRWSWSAAAPRQPLGHGQPPGARPPAGAGAGHEAGPDRARRRRDRLLGRPGLHRRRLLAPRARPSSTCRWTSSSTRPRWSGRTSAGAAGSSRTPRRSRRSATCSRRRAAGARARHRRLGRRRRGGRPAARGVARPPGDHQRHGPRRRTRRAPAAGDQGPRQAAFGTADLVVVVGTPLDFRLGYGVFGGKDGATAAGSCTSRTPRARSRGTPTSPARRTAT